VSASGRAAAGGEAEPYWAAASEGRLVLPRCDGCDLVIWYPRGFCPRCLTRDVRWTELTGRGSVYSSTLVERGGVRPDGAPYVVAYVELVEGPRILAEVRSGGVAVAIGGAVRVAFEDADAVAPGLYFVPDSQS
jgi:uncharacterized OB-fold protein